MTTVYLIDIEDFKRRADISQGLNTDKLKGDIGITQEKFVVKILCQKLYNEIIGEFPDSLSTVNTALLPLIQDFLVYKTYTRYLKGANTFSTPVGMRVQTDTTSDVASDDQMKSLRGEALSDANHYQEQLVNFLIKNVDDYPLWKDSVCNCATSARPVNANVFSRVGKSGKTQVIRWT